MENYEGIFPDDTAIDSDVLPYSYPCENYISKIVSNSIIKYALEKFFDSHIAEDIRKIDIESFKVNEKSFPETYGILQTCCQRLEITNIPKLAVSTRLKGVNSITVGTDHDPMILISPIAIASLNKAELSFLIGHELGHIAQKNLICHTVKGALDAFNKWSEAIGPIISGLIEVPLNRWYRCSEFTSDRAGVICCEDLQTAVSLLKKISMKLNQTTTSIWDSYLELSSDHPTLRNRIDELEKIRKNKVLKDSFERYYSSIK
jgi:Zn-dependent protease with chaperone function